MGKATTIRMMLTLAASLAITACGFHLRGSYEMPAGLHALTLTTPGSSAALRDELALTLGRAHVSTDGGDILLPHAGGYSITEDQPTFALEVFFFSS